MDLLKLVRLEQRIRPSCLKPSCFGRPVSLASTLKFVRDLTRVAFSPNTLLFVSVASAQLPYFIKIIFFFFDLTLSKFNEPF